MANSRYVAGLTPEALQDLREKLHSIQSGRCYICRKPIDLEHHDGTLELDHIEPLAVGGRDTDVNLALTHSTCNRNKGASDLRVAQCLAELRSLEEAAKGRGDRGANLGDVLKSRGGAKKSLRLKRSEDGVGVEFSFPHADDNEIRAAPLYTDKLSGLEYFFAVVPLKYIHHDDVINPRSIGSSVRGLIEEFLKERPQLHVGLAWWTPDGDGTGPLKLFDGQHKAAAQILLGVEHLPVRVFVEPPVNLLVQTNSNAGSVLRQVAFDKAVMRRLGSRQYGDRLTQYQTMHNLPEDDFSFSEQDLVKHFRGERQMLRYIIDAQRNEIAHAGDNRLREFVEWSGKGAERPMAYSTVESAFFPLLYQRALSSPIDDGAVRELECRQMVSVMNLFADTFLVGWDFDIGGRQLESKIQKGEKFPPEHLRAWRICRQEVAVNVLRWVRLVIENYNAVTGRQVERERLFLEEFPDLLWGNIERFFARLSELTCWTNTELSSSVFGPKQNQDYWESVFRTGKSPSGTVILPRGLELQEMIAQS
ncbi:MAG: HNH endonuclease [Chloroflexi bacterium]|nr:HNH endonuclease [Chloroflexota bacterium]